MITFLFCLTGELNMIVVDNHQKNKLHLAANTFGAHYAPGGQYIYEYPLDKHVQIFRIFFPYKVFIDILGESDMSAGLQDLTKKQKIFSQINPITLDMHLNISQMLNPSLREADQNFFFIARIMDLINCTLNSTPGKIGPQITPLEQKQAEKARDILENNIENPPSLNDLAGRVGVSLAKFKLIFSKTYGIPPYCYLRKLRMKKAMQLLNNREMNVTQAAYEVGYNSLSHFSNVFVKHFGIKPSEVRNLSGFNNLSDK